MAFEAAAPVGGTGPAVQASRRAVAISAQTAPSGWRPWRAVHIIRAEDKLAALDRHPDLI